MPIKASQKLPTIKAVIHGDDNHWTGVQCISFVDFPAIEADFIALSHQAKQKTLTPSQVLMKANAVQFVETQGLKGYVTGPVLIPGKEILRYDDHTDSYYNLVFDADTIMKVMQRWSVRHMQDMANAMHSEPVEKTTFFESTYIRSTDHAKSLGLDLPAGSWVVTAKVNDPELLARIESKELKGFSIEGYFYYEPQGEELQALTNKNNNPPEAATTNNGGKGEVKNMGYQIPDWLKKVQRRFRRHLGEEIHLAQYVISDGNTIDVDDESGAAKLVDSEGNLGESPADGTYAVADSSDILVIYGGSWVRTTTSNAAASVELALQKLVADGSDRATIEQSILDGTGMTSDEWSNWMAGSYGCVDLSKIETIAAAVGIEADTLKAAAEQDGCSFEETTDTMAEVAAKACKEVDMRKATIQLALERKTFKIKAAAQAVSDTTTPASGKVEAGGMMVNGDLLVYISHYDGTIYKVDMDTLYCSEYLPVGDYTLGDGRKLVVIAKTEVYSEGTEYEWQYTYHIVDWANSELQAEDVLSWIKDQVGTTASSEVEAKHAAEMSAVNLAAEAYKADAVKSKTDLTTANNTITELKAQIAKLTAEVKAKDEVIAKLNALPGANPVGVVATPKQETAFSKKMQENLEYVKRLSNLNQ